MKYKVGDYVTIKKDLERGQAVRPKDDKDDHWTVAALSEMAAMRGKRVKITDVIERANRYQVEGSVWLWSETMFEPASENTNKIVITSDGKDTIAKLYDGKKVVKSATAKCHPEDAFDFMAGAKVAFDRLTKEESGKEETEWRVVNRPAKVGDYIRLRIADYSFARVGDVLRVDIVNNPYAAHVYGRNHPRRTCNDDHAWCYLSCQYEVIEPVKKKDKQEYFSGKAVCVRCRIVPNNFKVGKVYEFVDGVVVDEKGGKYINIKNIEGFTRRGMLKFIPLVE